MANPHKPKIIFIGLIFVAFIGIVVVGTKREERAWTVQSAAAPPAVQTLPQKSKAEQAAEDAKIHEEYLRSLKAPVPKEVLEANQEANRRRAEERAKVVRSCTQYLADIHLKTYAELSMTERKMREQCLLELQ